MPRYKITQHLTGWKVIENSIDAKDEDEAWEKYEGSNWVNVEWKEVEQEYKVTDTEIHKDSETWSEGHKKWKEKNEKEKN